jgi:hypothetical protein
MDQLQFVLDDLRENLNEIPDLILTNGSADYTSESFTTSGGWSIFTTNNKFMRLSAIKTWTDRTYFVHLTRDNKGITVTDAGNEPAVISSDGLIMFLNRPTHMPNILYSTKYCDIEIYLVKDNLVP